VPILARNNSLGVRPSPPKANKRWGHTIHSNIRGDKPSTAFPEKAAARGLYPGSGSLVGDQVPDNSISLTVDAVSGNASIDVWIPISDQLSAHGADYIDFVDCRNTQNINHELLRLLNEKPSFSDLYCLQRHAIRV
jgi:hypothetical protein